MANTEKIIQHLTKWYTENSKDWKRWYTQNMPLLQVDGDPTQGELNAIRKEITKTLGALDNLWQIAEFDCQLNSTGNQYAILLKLVANNLQFQENRKRQIVHVRGKTIVGLIYHLQKLIEEKPEVGDYQIGSQLIVDHEFKLLNCECESPQ